MNDGKIILFPLYQPYLFWAARLSKIKRNILQEECMSSQSDRHLGKKILYAFIIFLCALVILVSAASVVGAWAIRNPVTDAAVAILTVVEETAGTAQQVTARVDQATEKLQSVTLKIEDASSQISQNVSDKGLVLTLLPEEQEQNLISSARSAKDAFLSIQATLVSALELYRSIDRLPFVNLPAPDDEQLQKIQSFITQVETTAEMLRSSIADFRSGVTDKLDKVTSAIDSLNNEVQGVRDGLTQLNSKLAALEAFALRMQQIIPGVLTTLAVVLTLFLAFLIYTQVEVIRLFVARWRRLG
jgi:hypothetical protein